MRKQTLLMTAVVTAFVAMVMLTGCAGKSTTTTTSTTKPGSGAVVNSDSVVTAIIESITKQSTGYPWKVDVLIQSTVDVNNLPNPVKDDIGKVVTVVTDQNMSNFKVDDVVTAQIKYVGDVNIPAGISLYMYTIQPEVKPTTY
jgi:hypothetical protein